MDGAGALIGAPAFGMACHESAAEACRPHNPYSPIAASRPSSSSYTS